MLGTPEHHSEQVWVKPFLIGPSLPRGDRVCLPACFLRAIFVLVCPLLGVLAVGDVVRAWACVRALVFGELLRAASVFGSVEASCTSGDRSQCDALRVWFED